MYEVNGMWEEAMPFYPTHTDIDRWSAHLLDKSQDVAICGDLLDNMPVRVPFGNSPNSLVNRYVRFTANDGRRPFYGYWQPALNTPAPLLINLPGYGGSITMHPQLSDLGYHILHISPLGYVTPEATVDAPCSFGWLLACASEYSGGEGWRI